MFIVSGNFNDELLNTWRATYPHIPGFLKETVELVRMSDSNSPSAILKDTLEYIKRYSHLDEKQILVVYAGENTATLCNSLTTHTLDLSLLTTSLVRTFNSFKNPNRKELFPWMLSGEIMRCVEKRE